MLCAPIHWPRLNASSSPPLRIALSSRNVSSGSSSGRIGGLCVWYPGGIAPALSPCCSIRYSPMFSSCGCRSSCFLLLNRSLKFLAMSYTSSSLMYSGYSSASARSPYLIVSNAVTVCPALHPYGFALMYESPGLIC